MRTEYQQIFDKVKKLINEQKEKKVIRIDNILNKLFQWDSIDELIDFNYNLERTLQCHPLDRIRGIFGSHLISGQSIMRGWHSYTLYSTLIVFKPHARSLRVFASISPSTLDMNWRLTSSICTKYLASVMIWKSVTAAILPMSLTYARKSWLGSGRTRRPTTKSSSRRDIHWTEVMMNTHTEPNVSGMVSSTTRWK